MLGSPEIAKDILLLSKLLAVTSYRVFYNYFFNVSISIDPPVNYITLKLRFGLESILGSKISVQSKSVCRVIIHLELCDISVFPTRITQAATQSKHSHMLLLLIKVIEKRLFFFDKEIQNRLVLQLLKTEPPCHTPLFISILG